ncbi:MAG: helix-turn-helix transcriptional regulator [Blastochloris sp.]|nr:helix-turn-helix transcriptional regulator [Blastochloris sp.]
MKKIVSPFRGSEPPLALSYVSHYHQRHGTQPLPSLLQVGQERVELMTGGRGWIEHEGTWQELGPGDLIWNRAGDHTIGRSDPEHPYRCLAIHFQVRPSRRRLLPRLSFWPDLEACRSLAEEAPRLFVDERFDRQALMLHLHGLMLFQVRRHELATRSGLYPPQVRAVMEHIKSHYADPLPMKLLAQKAGCSVPHLHDVFRQHTGTSPHQWLLHYRLRKVKERLVGSLDPIKQIAHECGFSAPAALAHSFRAHTGRSPLAFRRHYFGLDL